MKMAKDPICGMDVREDTKWKLSKGGETTYFCSRSCRDAFSGKAGKGHEEGQPVSAPAEGKGQEKGQEKLSLSITGMHCASCAQNIEKRIRREAGVLGASVSYTAGKALVEYFPGKISDKK